MTDERQDLATIATGYLNAFPPEFAIDVRFEGCALRLRTNARPLCEALADYYHDYVVPPVLAQDYEVSLLEAPAQEVRLPLTAYPPAPGKARIKDEYIDLPDGRLLRKRTTKMVFLFGRAANVAVGPCLDNLNQIVNFVNNRYIEWHIQRGFLLCHAAGVARDARGIAIAGLAGRGKSTLTLHLLNRGLNLVSNDRLLIRSQGPNLAMVGLPKYPRVNPGTLLNNPRLEPLLTPGDRERFAALPRDQLWSLEHKYDVDVARVYGPGRVTLSATLAGVLLLTWQHGPGPAQADRANLAQRPDLLEALAKSPGVHWRRLQGAPRLVFDDTEYLDTLAGCPILEVSGGIDFDRATAAGLQLLEGGWSR